jgi:hypothetical protein
MRVRHRPLNQHGPRPLLAVRTAQSRLTPRFCNSFTRLPNRFHCLHATDQSRRRIHESRCTRTQGVWQNPK